MHAHYRPDLRDCSVERDLMPSSTIKRSNAFTSAPVPPMAKPNAVLTFEMVDHAVDSSCRKRIAAQKQWLDRKRTAQLVVRLR
jgi:hypothetical protein